MDESHAKSVLIVLQSDTNNTAKCGGKIIGLCDVDAGILAPMAKKYPDAQTFNDFREMLTKMGDQIDGVTVSTPDHLHGVAESWRCRWVSTFTAKNLLLRPFGNPA